MVLRKLPVGWIDKRKDFFYHHSTFRKKASVARDLGAKGIIFVTDFTEPEDKLIEFSSGTTNETMSIQSVMITRSVASRIFQEQQRDFKKRRETAITSPNAETKSKAFSKVFRGFPRFAPNPTKTSDFNIHPDFTKTQLNCVSRLFNIDANLA